MGREVAVEGGRSDVRFLAAGWERADPVRGVRFGFVFVRVRSLFIDHAEVFFSPRTLKRRSVYQAVLPRSSKGQLIVRIEFDRIPRRSTSL